MPVFLGWCFSSSPTASVAPLPSVWSVSVFFFQAALLVGYLYAHLLINKVPPHLTGPVHLAVCVAAAVCLPSCQPRALPVALDIQ